MFAFHERWEPAWQASLFGFDDPAVDASFASLAHIELDPSTWLDHVPAWLAGSDHVFAELVARLPWRQRQVPMYGKLLDEPRLTWWWGGPAGDGGPEPLPVLADARRTLSERYGGKAFDSIGCNYYRNGRDSVAWHGDRIRHRLERPLVAIVSVGAPRPFQLRPRGGGPSQTFLLGQGDLLVMGGDCQHTWEHRVPKVAVAAPRLSITFRHDTEPTRRQCTQRPSLCR